MIISDGYNQSLLEIIAKRRVITFEDLMKEYLTKIAHCFVDGAKNNLDFDLDILEKEQYIKISDDKIIYIGS